MRLQDRTGEPPAPWPRIAVVGAGAVGAFFGARLAHAGAPLVLIGRQPFVDAVERDGLFIESESGPLHVRVPVSTALSACCDAELVLFCVKTVDTQATARALAPHLAADAVVLTLQNGVEGAGQVRAATTCEVLSAAVYVAVATAQPGRIRHFGRGDLIIGPDGDTARRIAALCAAAAIPCQVSEDITGELWCKLLINCALNAISALSQTHYARILSVPPARRLVENVLAEVLAVARAANVRLPRLGTLPEALAAVSQLVTQMPGQRSSMAQDLARGRLTEIDALNGYVYRRGTALGVPAPANQALFALVKLAESLATEPLTASPGV